MRIDHFRDKYRWNLAFIIKTAYMHIEFLSGTNCIRNRLVIKHTLSMAVIPAVCRRGNPLFLRHGSPTKNLGDDSL